MQEHKLQEEFSFRRLFVPLTTAKAIHWIIFIGLLVFFNSLFNGFVEDDISYIISVPQSHVINLTYAFGNNVFNSLGQYRPIPALCFSVLYTLFGPNAFFYHALQVILHIDCAIVLYLLYRKFLSIQISFFLAIVFLIHPIQVESVSYIAQTVSPLFFLFGIIPLLLAMREKLSTKALICMFFLELLSLLTKETGVVFLLLLVTYALLFARKKLVKFSVASFITLTIYLFFRFYVAHVGFEARTLAPIASMTFLERLINIPMIMFYYFKIFFYPKSLAFDQQWVVNTINFPNFYLPLLIDSILIIFLCLAALYIKKYQKPTMKAYLFFSIWFLAGLFLCLQIFPLDHTVAD
jgi:hypothetical protein